MLLLSVDIVVVAGVVAVAAVDVVVVAAVTVVAVDVAVVVDVVVFIVAIAVIVDVIVDGGIGAVPDAAFMLVNGIALVAVIDTACASSTVRASSIKKERQSC